jgi:hypothetical protein
MVSPFGQFRIRALAWPMQFEKANTTADARPNTGDVVTTERCGPHRREGFLDD